MGRPEREVSPDGLQWFSHSVNTIDWYPDAQYRIKSKPWINWEHVSDDVLAMATDANGTSLLFYEKPVKINSYWDVFHTISLSICSHKSFTLGTCDWRDSLVMRPVVIGE